MPKRTTQILTNHQKKLLSQLLELGENNEETFTLTELEGFFENKNWAE